MSAGENRTTLALSRAWFAIDVAVGYAAGARCPNCMTPPRRADRAYRRHGLAVWQCAACGLLFRPVGFGDGPALSFYYTRLYGNAGPATELGGPDAPDRLARAVHERDRLGFVERFVRAADEYPGATLCILGCSWGYELVPFRDRGYRVFGIELGAARREHGRRALGLDLFATPADAAAAGRRADVVLSSHMLEHVPRVGRFLDEVRAHLQPRLQLHATPYVDRVRQDPMLRTIIGREHPIGIGAAFWERYGAARGLRVECTVDGYQPGRDCGELVAVLRERAATAP